MWESKYDYLWRYIFCLLLPFMTLLMEFYLIIYTNKGTVSVCVCLCVRDQLIAKFAHFATSTTQPKLTPNPPNIKSSQYQIHPTANPPNATPTQSQTHPKPSLLMQNPPEAKPTQHQTNPTTNLPDASCYNHMYQMPHLPGEAATTKWTNCHNNLDQNFNITVQTKYVC